MQAGPLARVEALEQAEWGAWVVLLELVVEATLG
jgi:hypothetical protein